MKKLLSILVICLSLSVTSNAMKRNERPTQQLIEHPEQMVVVSLVGASFPEEILKQIVCCLDFQGFIIFGITCKRSYLICEDVPEEYLARIAIQAAEEGNKNFVCRYAGLYPEGITLEKSSQTIFSLWLEGQNHRQLLTLLLPVTPSAQDCKDALLIASEFAAPGLFTQLFRNDNLTVLIDQDCADALVKKCTELQRLDLRQILYATPKIYDQLSIDVMLGLMNMQDMDTEGPKVEGLSDSDNQEQDLSINIEIS